MTKSHTQRVRLFYCEVSMPPFRGLNASLYLYQIIQEICSFTKTLNIY
nr:MAG TPA: hypothetical protein [Caudoviricetes sp.]